MFNKNKNKINIEYLSVVMGVFLCPAHAVVSEFTSIIRKTFRNSIGLFRHWQLSCSLHFGKVSNCKRKIPKPTESKVKTRKDTYNFLPRIPPLANHIIHMERLPCTVGVNQVTNPQICSAQHN